MQNYNILVFLGSDINTNIFGFWKYNKAFRSVTFLDTHLYYKIIINNRMHSLL